MGEAEVFVSYSSQDRQTVIDIVDALRLDGITFWRDGAEILGGQNYGPVIARAIKQSTALMLMCSDAALRSRNVKQEIQLAWKHEVPYLPVLLHAISFPEQVEYWLEGCQWVAVYDRPAEQWRTEIATALQALGVAGTLTAQKNSSGRSAGLSDLWSMASFTDRIWPVPALQTTTVGRGTTRDLGAAQEDVLHSFALGSKVQLIVEADRDGHLLLIDRGTSGKVYCLCPSEFASDTAIRAGRNHFPRPGARHPAFTVSGAPGREHLLAIITEEPFELNWMPEDPRTPARVLNSDDLDLLPKRLRSMRSDSWSALATYFDITS
jgi:hypothetical protein